MQKNKAGTNFDNIFAISLNIIEGKKRLARMKVKIKPKIRISSRSTTGIAIKIATMLLTVLSFLSPKTSCNLSYFNVNDC